MMNNKTRLAFILLPAVFAAGVGCAQTEASSSPYKLGNIFKIGAEGGWDYLTVDAEHHLLYVPRSTHTLVLNATDGTTTADIPGQKRNHGVALVPAVGRGFITDGQDASVSIFDLKSNQVLGKIKAQEDADGIIFDSASNKVLFVCGDSGILIPLSPDVDPSSGKADPAIELGGKAEFLAADGRGHAYVNLMDKDQVASVDLHAMKVDAHWSTAPGGSPVGMAIDRAHHRLFIGCRKPQKLIVMDTTEGKVIADLPIGAGVDAVQYDDGFALASCGDGTVTVVGETSPGKFAVVQTLVTRPGARTMGLDPTTHTLYLPTAEMMPVEGKRPRPKPGTFMIIEVKRSQ